MRMPSNKTSISTLAGLLFCLVDLEHATNMPLYINEADLIG